MKNETIVDEPPVNGLIPVDIIPCGKPEGLRIPRGSRVFMIAGEVCWVPGPNGAMRIYAHPDDVANIRQANGLA